MMEIEVKPQNKFSLGLNELWQYRELFYYFTMRDLKVKYKKTVLGVLWAVLQPLALSFLFSFLLGKAISVYTSINIPYVVFAMSGLVIWGAFSSGLQNAGNSMESNSDILKKVYFPRLIIPISSVLVVILDSIIGFSAFVIYCAFNQLTFKTEAILFFPLAMLLTSIAAIGSGTLLAALNLKYRDFRHKIPFLIQFMFFASPVIYPISITNNALLTWFLALNPMTAPLDIFRATLIGEELHLMQDGISIFSSLILLVIGMVYFRKTEVCFADLV